MHNTAYPLAHTFSRKQAHSLRSYMEKADRDVGAPMQLDIPCWLVGSLVLPDHAGVSRGLWALCADWPVALPGANVPVPIPFPFAARQPEATESQKMLDRFCPNIPLSGHLRPSKEERVCYIFPSRKRIHISIYVESC